MTSFLVGGGWTLWDMASTLLDMVILISSVKISLDAGNSSSALTNFFIKLYHAVDLNTSLLIFFRVLLRMAVKMSVTWGQSAWVSISVIIKLVYVLMTAVGPSETQRETSDSMVPSKSIGNIIPSQQRNEFQQWLVGVVDGDGSFTFSKSNGKWSLFFKISQSAYNLRILYYIKSKLGVGSIYVDKDNNMASFRIRRLSHVILYILPIFQKYPLLTSKFYNYDLFKQAALILSNESLTTSQKDSLLIDLKNLSGCIPSGYISPAWDKVNREVTTKELATTVMSKPWLIGFTEAEGSFYLVAKGARRLVHSFAMTQKLDYIVLLAIAFILQTKVVTKRSYIAVDTSKAATISFIIKYFHNTMKGIKSVEYSIWAHSFSKTTFSSSSEERFNYLYIIRERMRHLRSKRHDSCFRLSHLRVPPLRGIKGPVI